MTKKDCCSPTFKPKNVFFKAQIVSYLIKDVGTNVFAYSILHRTTVDVKNTCNLSCSWKRVYNLSRACDTGGVCVVMVKCTVLDSRRHCSNSYKQQINLVMNEYYDLFQVFSSH